MALRGLVCIALSAVIIGCAEEPDQTIVILEADDDALEGASMLRVQVCDGSGELQHDQSVFLTSVSFPGRELIPINPLGGDLSRRFGLEATLLTSGGVPLQSQRALASFPGGKAEVTRRFDRACATVSCPPHQTCVGGSCENASAPWLTISDEDAATLLACAQQEQCNGVDDDFDGEIDEGNAPAVMPTVCDVAMGRTEIMDEWMSAAAHRPRVNFVELSGCDRLGSAYMYLHGQGDAGYQPFRVLIYSSVDGEPAELLATTGEVRINGGTEPMWYEFSDWDAEDVRLEPGEYWLGSIAGEPVGVNSDEANYNGLAHGEGERIGRLGDDDVYDYNDSLDGAFVEDEIRTLDREITMFVECAP